MRPTSVDAAPAQTRQTIARDGKVRAGHGPGKRAIIARLALVSGITIALAVACKLVLGGYGLTIVEQVAILALVAISVDLMYGYAGMPSLGQAAYFGVGAYTVAILVTRYGITSFWLALLASLVTSLVVAAVFAVAALRTRGVYFLLVTFALGELFAAAATSVPQLSTPGIDGIAGVTPDPPMGGTWDENSIYWTLIVMFLVVVLGAMLLGQSPFGLALRGLEGSNMRLESWSYNTWALRYAIFLIAGAIAGVAGMMFTLQSNVVVPDNFSVSASALAFLMVVVGGKGKVYGAVVGAVVITILQYEASSWLPERWPLVLGGVYVLVALAGRYKLGRRARLGASKATEWLFAFVAPNGLSGGRRLRG